MHLSEDIKSVLKQHELLDLPKLKNVTRADLKNMDLDNQQINQVIIYLQLNGFDIKKCPKK